MDQKQQIADRLKQANNILVTVSNNPSVDQLASCIGLTLALNKMGKHATAVFSGEVPSTIEFLQPEKTIEANTDSLRDFIISLDKTKADKLRYKVEDKVVKIFITPYRTSISDKDLDFSQGDFNVDVVLALGVHAQTDLDQAITSHGRILHDATVATLNVKPGGELGSLNWLDTKASSLSELVVELVDVLDKKLIDAQVATALLTGIVAETGRFGNEKTSPATMSISAELMGAGANQQLVATKLEAPEPPAPEPAEPKAGDMSESSDHKIGEGDASKPVEAKAEDGALEISHDNKPEAEPPGIVLEDADDSDKQDKDKPIETPQIRIDEQGALHNMEEAEDKEAADSSTDPTQHMGGSRMILQPPTMGGAMNAGGPSEEGFSNDPLALPRPSDPSASSQAADSPQFAPSPASATIVAPPLPYMPPSMTPGAPAPGPSTASVTPQPSASPAPQAPPESSAPQPFMFPPSAVPADSPPANVPDLTPSPSTSGAPVQGLPVQHVDNARDAVSQAFASQPANLRPEPIHALNAQPLGDRLHDQPVVPPDLNTPVPAEPQSTGLNMPAPVGAPPPVPPPMMPPAPQ